MMHVSPQVQGDQKPGRDVPSVRSWRTASWWADWTRSSSRSCMRASVGGAASGSADPATVAVMVMTAVVIPEMLFTRALVNRDDPLK